MRVDDRLYLLLPVAALVILAATTAWLVVNRHRRIGAMKPWLVGAAAVAFVYLGVGGLNSSTNGRAAPDETAPWLALIAFAAGAYYLGLPQRVWRMRTSPRAVAPEAPARSGPPPVTEALIFISYRRSDSSDVAGRIYDRLVQQFGRDRIFKDVDSIPLGVDFRKHLTEKVGQCRILLAIIGQNWQRSAADTRDYVRIEIEAALQRGIPVIPILVQNATLPAEEQLPASLQALAYQNGLSVRPDPDFHQDVDRLIRGLQSHTG